MGSFSRAQYTVLISMLTVFKMSVDRYISGPDWQGEWFHLLVPGLLPSLRSGLEGNGWTLSLVAGCIATFFALILVRGRLLNAGISLFTLPLLAIPYLNMMLVFLLMFPPSKEEWSEDGSGRGVLQRLLPATPYESTILAVAVSVLFGILVVLILGSLGGHYGWTLFMGTPFLSNWLAVAVVIRNKKLKWLDIILMVALNCLFLGALLVLFAIEGLICVLMYVPLAGLLGLAGGFTAFALKSMFVGGVSLRRSTVPFFVFMPLSLGLEQGIQPPLQHVTSSIEIQAEPDDIWPYLLAFPTIPNPEVWMFRYGVAYPTKAWTNGDGAGAIRYCEFNHGTFVEPIEIWEPPYRLQFSVTEQPVPMKELSPYRNVHPPHLEGYFESERGQFLLEPLGNGVTRVSGTTWYRHDLHPVGYWSWWTDYTIHQIHYRVLNHLKTVIEAEN